LTERNTLSKTHAGKGKKVKKKSGKKEYEDACNCDYGGRRKKEKGRKEAILSSLLKYRVSVSAGSWRNDSQRYIERRLSALGKKKRKKTNVLPVKKEKGDFGGWESQEPTTGKRSLIILFWVKKRGEGDF